MVLSGSCNFASALVDPNPLVHTKSGPQTRCNQADARKPIMWVTSSPKERCKDHEKKPLKNVHHLSQRHVACCLAANAPPAHELSYLLSFKNIRLHPEPWLTPPARTIRAFTAAGSTGAGSTWTGSALRLVFHIVKHVKPVRWQPAGTSKGMYAKIEHMCLNRRKLDELAAVGWHRSSVHARQSL